MLHICDWHLFVCWGRPAFYLKLYKLYFNKFTHLHLYSHTEFCVLWRKYHIDSASCWMLRMFLPVREYMTVSRGSKTKCVRWWKQSLCVVCRTFVPFWYYCHSWFSFYSTCKLSDCCHQLLLLWSFLKFLSILRFINWIQFTTFPPQPYNQTETDVFIPRV